MEKAPDNVSLATRCLGLIHAGSHPAKKCITPFYYSTSYLHPLSVKLGLKTCGGIWTASPCCGEQKALRGCPPPFSTSVTAPIQSLW